MAEAGNPGLTFNTNSVIYGGRTLKDLWRLGTQHIVNQHAATKEEVQATVDALESASKDTKIQRIQMIFNELPGKDTRNFNS